MQQTTLPKEETRLAVGLAGRFGLGPVWAALALGLVGLAVLFWTEGRAAVEIWDESTAYGHCYLILPMTLFLLWERRAIFKAIPPRSELRWAVLGVPIGAVWLVAERLGIMEGRQLLALAAVELLLLVLLGWRLFWNVSGPLLYLFFLVPFGAFLTPVLQRFTAHFSIVGLDLLGIPNYSDNFTIETPAGVFFVAEACAGLRFLIAAIAFGVFYALLNFRGPGKRAAFIAASILVPIVANGFRALGIVVLGQILGSAEAAAADHIVYGWVFFSFVMLLLVLAGHPFRDAVDARAPAASVGGRPLGSWAAIGGALAAVGLVAIGPAVAMAIDTHAVAARLAGPLAWQTPEACETPAAQQGRGTTVRFSVRCGETTFQAQLTAFPARSTAGVSVVERRRITQEIGAEDVSVARLSGIEPDRGEWTVVQTTDPSRVTAYASWVDGAPVASGLAARVAQARDSIMGGDHTPMLLTVTTAEAERAPPAVRRAIMEQLRTVISAQAGLNAEIERLSRVR